MSTCRCNNAAKLSVKLPVYAPDEKLAFVERVCGLLIESRYGSDRRFIPLGNFSKASDAVEDDLDARLDCTQPRSARPPAPSKKSSPPATVDPRMGIRELIRSFATTHFSPTPVARGSPAS